MPDPSSRELDLVLFGATGFTGGLTADYLAEHGPHGLRWALAGRSLDKLTRTRDRLVAAHPDRTGLGELELIVADASDAAALADVAARTAVVITTVGPYLAYGEPLVAACAEAGTDYVDLTGEPEFVDRMYVAHHSTAARTGARIVHACGFDSIPHDLGAYFTVRELQSEAPITLRGVVRGGGAVSGGTFHSALGAFSRAKQMSAAAKERKRVQRDSGAGARAEGRRSRAVTGKPHRDRELGLWLLPMPTIDPAVVARSGGALAAYGPDFRYSHYAGVKTLRYAVGGAVGVTSLMLAAQVPPVRNLLLGRLQPGQGPSEERRAASWFTVDFVAESAGRTLHTRVAGGDPGYGETSKMLAEAALCLAFDDNPVTVGCVTTAEAMGSALLARLIAVGIAFDVVS